MTDDAKNSDDKSGDEQSGSSFLGSRLPDHTLSNASFPQLLHDLKNSGHNTGTSHRQFFDEDELMTADELDAKLGQNKAEVNAVASEMRREMAEFRTHYIEQFSSINENLSVIKNQISEVKGEVGGLKTSLTTTQWAMAIGLTMVTVVLSGVMLVSSWIISSNENAAPVAAQQPIIIQVPQALQAQPPAPPAPIR